jgi:hypothetical protein
MAAETKSLRVLFCIAVLEEFFAADDDVRAELVDQLKDEFGDLGGKFGVEVLGTIDDDRTLVGPMVGFPWTCYILADAPDFDAVVSVCDLVRRPTGEKYRLFRYFKIEARVGQPLFFGNS